MRSFTTVLVLPGSPELWSRLLYGTEDYIYKIECIINELKIKPWSKIISQHDIIENNFTNSAQIQRNLKFLFEEKVFHPDETNDLTWKTVIENLQLIENLLITLINIKKGKNNKGESFSSFLFLFKLRDLNILITSAILFFVRCS